ncbi:MAG: hypothetical protein KDB37_07105 [Ilumatobacter sp.]|nr:hypothetical protein [Ilumatobacter sp.]
MAKFKLSSDGSTGGSRRVKIVVGVIVAVGLLVVGGSIAAASLNLRRTEANEWGCTFGRGPLDGKGLKGQFSPGSSGTWTNDDFVTGPADIRFYIIDEDPATADFGGRPIVVPARGSSNEGVGVVQVSVETQVRFVFNERFCEWYIDHGKRSEPLRFDGDPDTPSGWNSFLNASMNQKLIEAARPVVANQDYISLYVNAPIEDGLAYDVLAEKLSENLGRELARDLGGEYFCGPAYQFDGDIDGQLDEGCPPIEVTIKRVAPTDSTLIEKLETIVANEEQQRVIVSERDRQLEETAAKEQTELREQARRQAVEVAQAEADLAIAEAQEATLRQEQANAEVQATSDAAYCRELAAAGVDCALLAAAESGVYPRVIVGEGGDASILVDGGG